MLKHEPASSLSYPSSYQVCRDNSYRNVFCLFWGPEAPYSHALESAIPQAGESCGAKSGLWRLLDVTLDDWFGHCSVQISILPLLTLSSSSSAGLFLNHRSGSQGWPVDILLHTQCLYRLIPQMKMSQFFNPKPVIVWRFSKLEWTVANKDVKWRLWWDIAVSIGQCFLIWQFCTPTPGLGGESGNNLESLLVITIRQNRRPCCDI